MRFLIVDIAKRLGTTGEPHYAVRQLLDNLNKRQIPCDLASYSDIVLSTQGTVFDITVNGRSLTGYSHIIMRGHRTAYEYMLKQQIVSFADKNHIVVQNSRFIKCWTQYNKILQMQYLIDAGLPYLPSAYCIDGHYWEKPDILKKIGFPLIYKHIEGQYKIEIIDGEEKFKKNVYLVNSADELHEVCLAHDDIETTFINKPSMYFIQKYLNSGIDYRVILIGGKYYSGWKRVATSGFLTVNHGNYLLWDKPEPELRELALKTARILSADYCAVDIIYDGETPYILEVNMNPGFKSFETKIAGAPTDIAEKIIDELLAKK